jgi:hypothetical protein
MMVAAEPPALALVTAVAPRTAKASAVPSNGTASPGEAPHSAANVATTASKSGRFTIFFNRIESLIVVLLMQTAQLRTYPIPPN